MKFLKVLLLGLIALIVLTQIFNYPGSNSLQVFFQNQDKIHPPFLFLLLATIKKIFPLSNQSYFYNQSTWIASKIFVFSAYLLVFTLLIVFKNRIKKTKFDLIDVALLYFGSFSILLTSVSLHFFEILSAPFVLSAFIFARKNNSKFSLAALLIAIMFCWQIVVLLPVFILYFSKSKQLYNFSLFSFLLFLLFPSNFSNSEVFNLNWLLSYPYQTYIKHPSALMFPSLSQASLIFGVCSFVVITHWIRKNFLQRYIVFILPVLLLILGYHNLFQVTIFLFIFLKLKDKFANKLNFSSLLKFSLASFICYILFSFTTPVTLGLLSIAVLISLLLHLNLNNQFSFLTLLGMNILVFMNAFLRTGTAGVVPIRGEYFSFAIIPVAITIVFYYAYLLLRLFNISHNPKRLRFFIILFVILFNFAMLTANGSSDRVAWADYAKAAATEQNPFRAHALDSIDQRYPPLSTVIMSVFTNTWGKTLGFRDYGKTFAISPDYAQSVKVSVLIFYFATVLIFYKISKSKNSLFVILTTFSLVIQTQGMGDVNIYLIPTLIGAIFFVNKKKFLYSGLLMGATLSIKWQPVILLPLFAAAILQKKEFLKSLPNFIKFGIGLITVPFFSWMLVIIQPGGLDSFYRATEYLIAGAPKLSGQALNLNWIVTYVLHGVSTNPKIETLTHLEGLNRQIDTILAPAIFRGYFFIIAVLILTIHFFFRQRRNIQNFISGSFMIFFSHQILNKSAYEKHLFYSVIFLLVFYLIRPTKQNRVLLVLFDLMTVMNLIFFYGFTGPKDVNRMFLGFDLTVLFSAYYVLIYFYFFYRYFKTSGKLTV